MLERIWELQKAVIEWVKKNRAAYAVLQLNEEEWGHIDVLLELLKPFSQLTFAISTSLDVSVHEVFRLYNWLFEQLEHAKKEWEAKTDVSYRGELIKAITAARDKLDEYYSRTDGDHGTFYNLGTVLDPTRKLQYYEVCISC
jgi:hypothetical protein